MKIVKLIFFLFPILLYAENVEITSKNFEADEKKLISIFTGDVHIKKGKDKIRASKVIVYFDKDRKPIKYEALNNVKFKIVLDLNKTYEGRAQKIVYIPSRLEYIFEKDVYIIQKPDMRKVYGEKIILNRKTGQAVVRGTKDKPVKFIFNIEENSTKVNK